METTLLILIAVVAAAAGAGLAFFLAQRNGGTDAELAGRLSQMAESTAAQQAQLAERMQAQERAITKMLEERLGDLGKKVGDSLQLSSTKTGETMAKLQERLAVIDAAQKKITDLSTQVVGLQDILSNKQARGAFGEVQLQDLVKAALPPSAYGFQATLGNGRRADCLIKLPNPPGPIVIDAKFPLEGYRQLVDATDETRETARKRFAADVLTHVKHIAERYIVPGETAESALMFMPSEAVYAELHANLSHMVDQSYGYRVWIVSPTTLMATLNTVRAVLKDAHMREQAGLIQKEVLTMMEDIGRLDQRVENLEKHFSQAEKDLREIRTSAGKITRRGERIGELEFGEAGPEEALAAPPERLHRVGQ